MTHSGWHESFKDLARLKRKEAGMINLHCSACGRFIRHLDPKDVPLARTYYLCRRCDEFLARQDNTVKEIARRAGTEITYWRNQNGDFVKHVREHGFAGGKEVD